MLSIELALGGNVEMSNDIGSRRRGKEDEMSSLVLALVEVERRV